MNNLNVLELNNINFINYKSDSTPTITNNNLVDIEQRLINDYKNSGYNMADYAEAFRDLLKNEFSDDQIFTNPIEQRALLNCKVIAHEDGTFKIAYHGYLFTDKISAYNAKSFEGLYDFLKNHDLVVKNIENMRFLTFEQVRELTQMFDNYKEIEDQRGYMEFKQEFDHFSKKNYLSARKALRNQVQKAFNLSNGFRLPIGAVMLQAQTTAADWFTLSDEAQNAQPFKGAIKYRLYANLKARG